MKKVYLLSVLLLVVAGCDSSNDGRYDLIDHFSVPAEAYDVKKLKLGYGDSTQQIFFRVKESYPSLRVVNQYEEHLRKSGWAQCTGARKDWDSFEDASSVEPIHVHRVLQHWVNRKERLLLLLSATYTSKVDATKQPDNDVQNVVVWVQKTGNLQHEVDRLGIKCP